MTKFMKGQSIEAIAMRHRVHPDQVEAALRRAFDNLSKVKNRRAPVHER